jgi:hypothetical protein
MLVGHSVMQVLITARPVGWKLNQCQDNTDFV